MGSVCLSSASILRCTSLSTTENIVLVVPPALEVIFSTSLMFMKWGTGRRHLLVTAEGCLYLLLATLELVANIVPAVRDNLSLFRSFDLGIGVASFLPIFFYMFFLYLFTGSELIQALPQRIKRGSRLIIIIFIPIIVIFNEIASFIGISIGQVTIARQTSVVVGFVGPREEGFWTFFTSVTLALLTLFQAIVFSITFFRLFQALGHQQRIEEKKADMAHLIKGAAWISAALKLGAIETVVGFGGGGFGVVLTRRILRFLSRACLCIGLVKGIDSVEDFRTLRNEVLGIKASKQEWRGSRLRQFISNPRLSTFRQLSPTATAFHAIPRAPSALLEAMNSTEKPPVVEDPLVSKPIPSRALMEPAFPVTARRKSKLYKYRHNSMYAPSMKDEAFQEKPTMEHFTSLKEKASRQRVTVHYNGGAPTLHMRFSTLDVLSPAALSEKFSSRSPSTWDEEVYGSGYNRRSGFGVGYIENLDKNREMRNSVVNTVKGLESAPTYQTLMPPRPVLNRDSVSSVPSHTGPVEIVNTPRRTISVTKAPLAMVYRTSRVSPTEEERRPTDMSLETINESSTTPSRKSIVQSRSKSMSMASQSDSLQDIHDITSQFPGLPKQIQVLQKEPSSAAASSVFYPEVVILPRVPATVAEVHNATRDNVSGYPEDVSSWANSRRSSIALTPRTTTRKVDMIPEVPPLTEQQKANIAKTRSLDPFSPAESDMSERGRLPSSQPPVPRYIVPTGQPLRDTLGQAYDVILSTGIPSSTYRTRNMSLSEGMAEALSGFPVTREESPYGSDNPYGSLELGTALDSGKSRLFKSMQQQPPLSGAGQGGDDKLTRTALWVGSTSSVLVTPTTLPGATPDINASMSPNTPGLRVQPVTRNVSLQNLHDRGKSIDALSIGWYKGTDSRKQEQIISRVKSVGKVANKKATPTPVHTRGYSKVSMYLEPIIIPPRSNLQVIVQSGEIGSTPTPSATTHEENDIVEVSRT